MTHNLRKITDTYKMTRKSKIDLLLDKKRMQSKFDPQNRVRMIIAMSCSKTVRINATAAVVLSTSLMRIVNLLMKKLL